MACGNPHIPLFQFFEVQKLMQTGPVCLVAWIKSFANLSCFLKQTRNSQGLYMMDDGFKIESYNGKSVPASLPGPKNLQQS